MANSPSQSAVDTKSSGRMLDGYRTAPVNTSTIPTVEIRNVTTPKLYRATSRMLDRHGRTCVTAWMLPQSHRRRCVRKSRQVNGDVISM